MSVRIAKEGERVHDISARIVLGPKCDSDVHGLWVCCEHDVAFANNIQKDEHCRKRGNHLLYWVCNSHGFEAGAS